VIQVGANITHELEARLESLQLKTAGLQEKRDKVQREIDLLDQQIHKLHQLIEGYQTLLKLEASDVSQDGVPESGEIGKTSEEKASTNESTQSMIDLVPDLIKQGVSQSLISANKRSRSELIRDEFKGQNLTHNKMIQKILKDSPGAKHSVEEITRRIYNTFDDEELLRAKSSLASALSRGVKAKLWQGNRGQYFIETGSSEQSVTTQWGENELEGKLSNG
jgi:hypothetical protein